MPANARGFRQSRRSLPCAVISLCVIGVLNLCSAVTVFACPGAHDETFSGTVSYGTADNGRWNIPIVTDRCETFWVEATYQNTSIFSQSGTIQLVGEGVNPFALGNNTGIGASNTSFTVKVPANQNPIPNTVTGNGRLGLIVVHTSSQTALPVTVTVHMNPRPGYNTAGESFATAEPVGNNDTIHLTMIGNGAPYAYSKVILKPGGHLSVSGDLTNATTGYSMTFNVYVYNANQQQGTAIVYNKNVPANSTASFTSTTFTNTGTTTANYYIAWMHSGAGFMSASNLTIHADTAQLTLFLNAHPDPLNPALPDPNYFALTNPNSTNDVGGYIPGAKITDGTSLPLPTTSPIQKVELVAAYLDEQGNIVAPQTGNVTFSLEDSPGHSSSSAFEGVAMNWPDPRGEGLADFVLEASSVSFAPDKTARVLLDCWDYGGFATVSAIQGAATAPVATALPMRLPQDNDPSNLLPDAQWLAGGFMQDDSVLPSEDSDSAPAGNGMAGDGFSAYEEYRGFVVGGSHVRTDRQVKDVLAFSEFPTIGVGFASGTGLRFHEVTDEEFDQFDHRAAANYQNVGFGGDIPGHFVGVFSDGSTSEQLVLLVLDDLDVSVAVPLGVTAFHVVPGVTTLAGPPWATLATRVFSGRIRKLSPTNNSPTIVETSSDLPKLSQSVAHEIGHSVGLPDVEHPQLNGQPLCPPIADTVMVTRYFNAQNPGTNYSCQWSNIPFLYTASELTNFLRVR